MESYSYGTCRRCVVGGGLCHLEEVWIMRDLLTSVIYGMSRNGPSMEPVGTKTFMSNEEEF